MLMHGCGPRTRSTFRPDQGRLASGEWRNSTSSEDYRLISHCISICASICQKFWVPVIWAFRLRRAEADKNVTRWLWQQQTTGNCKIVVKNGGNFRYSSLFNAFSELVVVENPRFAVGISCVRCKTVCLCTVCWRLCQPECFIFVQ